MSIRKTILALALGAFALTPSIAAAQEREMPGGTTPMIPAGAKDCTFNSRTFASGAGFLVDPDTILNVSNGTGAKHVVIQYSAEANVGGAGGRLDLRWSLDGGAPVITGAEFFSGDTIFSTRTHISVLLVAGGNHTLRPFLAYNGPGVGTIFFRCGTVESKTK